MSLPVCVFLDRLSIDCDDLDFSAIQEITDLTTYDKTLDDEIMHRLSDATIVIVNKVKLDRLLMQPLPRLRLICVIATGTNNIDLEAARELGIQVSNVKDYAAASVSQHVFMLILALYTRFLDYQADIKNGEWQAQDQFCLLSYPTQELKGKTLGLVGYGHIAKAVEKIALAFGMQVVIAESLQKHQAESTHRVPLTNVLKTSDVISLHCPLTEQTRNLIAAAELKLMKPAAFIINSARGGIINEHDLIQALETGEIAGAGIDCLVEEPPSPDNPMINCTLPQLIITPHNAWGTLQARQRLVDGTCNNIKQFLTNA